MFNPKIHEIPINKTAAVVTGQSGCRDRQSKEQRREVILSRIKFIESEVDKYSKNHPERKRLNKEKNKIQIELGEIRSKKKGKRLQSFIIDILKEELSEMEYQRLKDRAYIRLQAYYDEDY